MSGWMSLIGAMRTKSNPQPMEFNEKLQELRRQRGLTQEELAEHLYVSRTAVSKWESGRGYPNIESLKAVGKFFSVSIDDLLSSDQVLDLAEADHKEREGHLRDLVFGLLDCSAVLLLFLPFLGQTVDGVVQGVSLLQLTEAASYLRTAYFVCVIGLVVTGFLLLAFQSLHQKVWQKNKYKLSFLFNGAGTILFIVGLQPYAAVFLFLFLVIKALLLMKLP